jgi:hypothetical protein
MLLFRWEIRLSVNPLLSRLENTPGSVFTYCALPRGPVLLDSTVHKKYVPIHLCVHLQEHTIIYYPVVYYANTPTGVFT